MGVLHALAMIQTIWKHVQMAQRPWINLKWDWAAHVPVPEHPHAKVVEIQHGALAHGHLRNVTIPNVGKPAKSVQLIPKECCYPVKADQVVPQTVGLIIVCHEEKNMNINMYNWRRLLFCFLMFSYSLGAEDTARIEQLRNMAIYWSTGLSSFSGKYTLYERHSDTFLVTHIDFRRFNESKYIKVIYEDRNNDTIEESFHKGSFISLLKKEEGSLEKSYIEVPKNQPSFNVPESSLFTPVQFFFQEEFWPEGDSMATALTRGNYVLRQQDNNEVLVRYDIYGCHDIYFDAMQRITKIDVFTGLGASEIEFARQMHLDFLELRYPYMTFIFDKYEHFKDTWFPLQVRQVTYRPNPEAQRIIDSLIRGRLKRNPQFLKSAKRVIS